MPPREPAGPAAVQAPAAPDPQAPRLSALDTRHFELAPGQELIGETQVIFARYENTFSAIGRQYNLGYEEMRSANPGVDQWLPGEGTPIYLPTQTILPDAPREGIVVNVPAMRLYYFETEKPAAGRRARDRQGFESSDRRRRGRLGDAVRRRESHREGARSRLVRAGVDPQGARRARRSAAERRAARARQSARRVRDDAVAAGVLDPRHEQAGRSRHALEPRLHSPVPRGHRSAVPARRARHRGAARQPARSRGLARRPALPRGSSAARRRAARSRRGGRSRAESRAREGRRRSRDRHDRSRGHRKDRRGATRHSVPGSARRALARAIPRGRAHRREHRSDRSSPRRRRGSWSRP